MKRILKWNVPIDDEVHEIGPGSVLRVECQHYSDSIQVWTHEDFGPSLPRMVQVVGTGQALHDDWLPLGSALTAEGRLVWHVMEVPS